MFTTTKAESEKLKNNARLLKETELLGSFDGARACLKRIRKLLSEEERHWIPSWVPMVFMTLIDVKTI